MPNMSYCQFQNTLDDLLDCNEEITDLLDKDIDKGVECTSTDELKAMEKMLYLVNEIKLGLEELGIEPEEC